MRRMARISSLVFLIVVLFESISSFQVRGETESTFLKSNYVDFEKFMNDSPENFLGRKRSYYLDDIKYTSNAELIRFFLETALGNEHTELQKPEDKIKRWAGEMNVKISVQKDFNENYNKVTEKVLLGLGRLIGVPVKIKFSDDVDILNDNNSYYSNLFYFVNKYTWRYINRKFSIKNNLGFPKYGTADDCFGGLREDMSGHYNFSVIFIIEQTDSVAEFTCILEEAFQIFGVLRDTDHFQKSIMLKNETRKIIRGADLFVLRTLYSEKLRPGFTRINVEKMLPQIVPEVREWFETCFIDPQCFEVAGR